MINYLTKNAYPVCAIIPAVNNRTWVTYDGEIYELSLFIPGETVMEQNEEQVYQCGRLLARFHELGMDFIHNGKSCFMREDHFEIIHPVLKGLKQLADGGIYKKEVEKLTHIAFSISENLDGYSSSHLEESVIHGDFHQGNILFHKGEISALIDLCYTSRGFTLRDIADGVMFITSRRKSPFNTDDIRSLTQWWEPDLKKISAFINGYKSVRAIPRGIEYLSQLLISRWIQCRVRGSRKVPDKEKLSFVFDGFWEVIYFLENEFEHVFNSVYKPA